jgi:hypothetical protein
MKSGVDTLNNCADWQHLYGLLPNSLKVLYASPGYYQAYQGVENCEIMCMWVYQDDHNFLFYPFLKKSINALGYQLGAKFSDISGAYGYGGPMGEADGPGIIEEFNNELLAWIKGNNVVTEFVRYCPLTGNRSFHTYTDQIDVLDNVYIDLTHGLDWIWDNSFEYRVRKTVRKGLSYGLTTELLSGHEIKASDLETFCQIYHSTMARNDADEFYFFDLSFFSSLIDHLGDRVVLAITSLDTKPISTEIVLEDGNLAFGFLGGTLKELYNYKANTFQRWELLQYLYERGIAKYSMGGGASRGDGIYSFKKGFSKDCDNLFYIGTKVHLPEVYGEILAQWRSNYPNSAELHSNKIQGYRIRA